MSPMTGSELRAWRKSHDLTTREAAKVLGCSHAAISRWENENRHNPFLGAAVEVAEEKLIRKRKRKA